jgi:hypothetical protein
VSLCASCGLELPGENNNLCTHHHAAYHDDWAEGNRKACAAIHRGEWPSKGDFPPEDPPIEWEGYTQDITGIFLPLVD